jgi:hypothetical protein
METVMERRRRGRSRRRRRDLEDDDDAPDTARFGEEGEVPGRRVLVQAAHVTKEVKEAPRNCLTDDEAPGRPAMARRRNFLAAAHTQRWRGTWGLHGRAKGRGRGSNLIFKGKGGGERKQWPGYWPSMAEGAPAAYCLQEGEGD